MRSFMRRPKSRIDVLPTIGNITPKFLPPAFSDFRVEEGGYGAGTVISFRGKTAGRVRDFRMRCHRARARPRSGGERHPLQHGDGLHSYAGGRRLTGKLRARAGMGQRRVGGFFERIFAPIALRRLYRDELARLDMYAQGRQPIELTGVSGGLPREHSGDVFCRQRGHSCACRERGAPDVGRDDAVVHSEERIVQRDRFRIGHVQGRTRDLAVPKSLVECTLIHQGPDQC